MLQLLEYARTSRKPDVELITTEDERQQALEFERVLLTTIGLFHRHCTLS